MRRAFTRALAMGLALTLLSNAGAAAASRTHARLHHGETHGRPPHGFVRAFGPIPHAHGASRARHRYVALVGDPGGGLGFYPLPWHYRVGAWRYRVTHRRPPWQNPVLSAIAADSLRYPYWIVANQGYHYGVFDPVEGLGTPFFAGFYGSGGGEDEEPPPPPGPP